MLESEILHFTLMNQLFSKPMAYLLCSYMQLLYFFGHLKLQHYYWQMSVFFELPLEINSHFLINYNFTFHTCGMKKLNMLIDVSTCVFHVEPTYLIECRSLLALSVKKAINCYMMLR